MAQDRPMPADVLARQFAERKFKEFEREIRGLYDKDARELNVKNNNLSRANDQLRGQIFDLQQRIQLLTSRAGFSSLEEAESSQDVSLLPPKVKERIGEAEEEIHRLQGEVTKHAQTNRQAFDALDEAKDEMAKAKEELEVQIKECERLRLERDSARKLAETKNAEVSALHQQIAEMKMKSSSAENPNTPVKHGSPRKPRRTFALSASPFASPLRERNQISNAPEDSPHTHKSYTELNKAYRRTKHELDTLTQQYDSLLQEKDKVSTKFSEKIVEWKKFKTWLFVDILDSDSKRSSSKKTDTERADRKKKILKTLEALGFPVEDEDDINEKDNRSRNILDSTNRTPSNSKPEHAQKDVVGGSPRDVPHTPPNYHERSLPGISVDISLERFATVKAEPSNATVRLSTEDDGAAQPSVPNPLKVEGGEDEDRLSLSTVRASPKSRQRNPPEFSSSTRRSNRDNRTEARVEDVFTVDQPLASTSKLLGKRKAPPSSSKEEEEVPSEALRRVDRRFIIPPVPKRIPASEPRGRTSRQLLDEKGEGGCRGPSKLSNSDHMKEHLGYKGRGRYGVPGPPKDVGDDAVFEINTARNGGLDYQFDEVVRNKETRKHLDAGDCECCRDYYEAIGPLPSRLRAPLWKSPSPKRVHQEGCKHRQASASVSPSKGKRNQAIEDHRQEISRHRHNWAPPSTPPDYWNIGFPTTQEAADINRRAEMMAKQKRAYIEAEASKENGKYKRRKQ